MALSAVKSGAACGAEIACDLAQDIDEATFREIERAFHADIVVVFRGQELFKRAAYRVQSPVRPRSRSTPEANISRR
jgi:alpha-ketoglutarate-dependent taurine dioxygenase